MGLKKCLKPTENKDDLDIERDTRKIRFFSKSTQNTKKLMLDGQVLHFLLVHCAWQTFTAHMNGMFLDTCYLLTPGCDAKQQIYYAIYACIANLVNVTTKSLFIFCGNRNSGTAALLCLGCGSIVAHPVQLLPNKIHNS